MRCDKYNVSKLMQLLAFRELAERLTQPPNSRCIITSTTNPGAVVTDITRQAKGFFSLYVKATQAILMRTAEEGVATQRKLWKELMDKLESI